MDQAQPKPESGSVGPGNKRVAAKAVKVSAAKSLFPSQENGETKSQAKLQAKGSSLRKVVHDSDTATSSDAPEVAPMKVAAAPKPAAKSEQKALNRASTMTMSSKQTQPEDKNLKRSASEKLFGKVRPANNPSASDGGSSDSSSGPVKVPAWKLALKAAAAGRAAGSAAVAEVMKGVQSPNPATVDKKTAPPTPASLMQAAHSRDSMNSKDGSAGSGRSSPTLSEQNRSAGLDSPRTSSGAASPFLGREKPSLRKAARMAAMLNRFAPPEAGPSEPKVPAWKLANEAALARKQSERSIHETASPPPAPAPTPAASRTTTPFDRSGSNSRPGTDMSGAYSDTDDGGISRDQSDTDYESTGMTDIPSGYDDTDLSDEGEQPRSNSAPPASTLFGVSMKKTLSRPADRVEQAERKAERLEQAEMRRGGSDSRHNVFLSESELSVSASGMSESEPERQHSKHLSSLERIIANSDNRAQAKVRQRPEVAPALSTFDDHNKTPKEHRDTAERGRDLIEKLLKSVHMEPSEPSATPVPKVPSPLPVPVEAAVASTIVQEEASSPSLEKKNASSLSQETLKAFGGGKVGKFKIAALMVKKENAERKSQERPEPKPPTPEPEEEVNPVEAALAPSKMSPVVSTVTAAMSLRMDVDRLSTQRISAGLKAEKHGSVDVSLIQHGEEGAATKRFLSVSAGGLYMATYFTLLDLDGYVECSASKLDGTSEKLCDLTKCSVDITESPLSLCGYVISVKLNRDKSRGVVIKPNRLGDLLEWGSVIQQCIDLLSVTPTRSVSQDGQRDLKRDSRGRVFRLPGQTDEVDTNSGRSREAEQMIWRIKLEKQNKEKLAVTETFEAKATKRGVIPTGADESSRVMNKMYKATNRPIEVQRRYQEMLVSPLPVSSKSKVFDMHEKERDPLLQQVLKLRNTGPHIPPPVAEPVTRPEPSLFDVTKGSRLGANPSNSPYLSNNSLKLGSGVSWLDDYRDMVRELDEMEFSTSRTLGFLAHENKGYANTNASSTSLYSRTIPAHGGVTNVSGGLLWRDKGTPSSSTAMPGSRDQDTSWTAPSGSLLSPGVQVPMVYNLNLKEFNPPPMNPFAY